MRTILLHVGLVLIIAGLASQEVCSQSALKKLRNKAQNEMLNKLLGEEEQETPPAQDPSRPGMANTEGGGLSGTVPDVNENIKLAESAYQSHTYTDARFSIRQALLGVELEMGQNVLKGLPDQVNGLPKQDEEDRVTNTGIGFVGLTIERVYRSDNQELSITIGNNASLLSATNAYLASGAYATTEEEYKVITFQGNRGIIEFDESSGYTLSVPFGQSSIMVVNGVNFQNEQAMMNAAENFDLGKIKKDLGEQ